MNSTSRFLIIFFISIFGRSVSQNFIPIASNGYSLDGVAENTTAISTTGGALDASDFILYSQYYGTLFSSNAVGIPNNGLISNSTRTYQLQPYNGYNVMHLFANTKDTLNILNPQPYPVISLLGFGTQGAATASITVRFTDNTTQVFSPITMDDWFTANPAVYNGFDRAPRTSGIPAYVASAGNPRMFAYDLPIACSNLGKSVKRIIVQNNSSSAHICVLAVSGTLPTYSINANPPFLCSNGNSTLTAVGLNSYTWQANGSFAGSNSVSVNVTPTATSVYTLLGTDGSGCPAYSTVTLNVSGAAPVLSLTGSSSSVCLGAAATLSASGAVTYTWSNGVLNGVPFTPSTTSSYTVVGQNGCGTSTTVSTVSVGPLPVSIVSTSSAVCVNKTATLSAQATASTYTWLPGTTQGTMSSISINPSVTTVYTVTASNGVCFGNASISIQANPTPTLSAFASSASVCPGESATLTASGGVNYTWTPVNLSGSLIAVSPSVTTVYTLTGDNSFGCTNNLIMIINVGVKPNMLVSASSLSICNGDSSTLTASAANTYTWANGPISNSFVVSPTQSSSFTVTGTNTLSGCNDTKTINLYVFTPTITINGQSTVCAGGTITFTASGANSYNWQPGGSPFATITFTPGSSTSYTVNTITPDGILNCHASTTVGVNVLPAPTLSTTVKKQVMCVKETNTLSVSGASTYVWTSTSSTLSGSSIIVTPAASGIFTFTVNGTNSAGCIALSVVQMTVNKCTGIVSHEESNFEIKVYPNPTSDNFIIQTEEDADLVIINALGQIVRNVKLRNENSYTADIQGLEAGLYFLRFENGTTGFEKKVVVTNQ